MMVARWIVTAALAAGTIMFFADPGTAAEATEVVATTTTENDSLDRFGKAVRFIGVCGVLSSLVWGTSIIIVSRNRKGRSS